MKQENETGQYIQSGTMKYRRTLTALFLGSFVTFADIYSTQPLIPVFTNDYHVLPAAASLSLSLTTGMLAIFLFMSSLFSDRFKRKNMMSLALILTAVLAILLPLCHGSFVLMLVVRGLQGMTVAGFPALAMGYINEEVHPKSLGAAMGIYVSGTSVGGMTGRIFIGVLTDYLGWEAALFILGAVSLAAGLVFWRLLPGSTHFVPKRVKFSEMLHKLFVNIKNPSLLIVYSFGFLLMGVFVTVYNYIGFPLTRAPYYLSQTFLGFIFIVYLTGTVSSAWMGKWTERIRRPKVIAIGLALILSGIGLIALPSLPVKIVGLAVLTFGFFGSHSVASSWVGKLADPDKKTQASSLYLLFYYAGSSLVGSGSGIAWHIWGWDGITLLVIVLISIALLLTWVIHRRRQAYA